MHSAETIFRAQADTFPDSILACDYIGKAFADKGQASKRGDINNRRLKEDVDQDLRRYLRDRT